MLFLLEDKSGDDSDVNNGVIITLATLLVIAVIGLMISIVINVFFVVQRKRSRCVVTSIYSTYSCIDESIVVDMMLMLISRVMLDTVMSNNQCQGTTPLRILDMPVLPGHLSQSMRILKLTINLIMMLKWMLILLIMLPTSLVRSL